MAEPYLSTSLRDFWGRRWNLTAGYTLRELIYEPIVEGRWIRLPGAGKKGKRPSTVRSIAGVMAAFSVSGIIHEYFIWRSTGVSNMEWFAFFFVSGIAVILESAIFSFWKKYNLPKFPSWMSIAITLLIMIVMAEWLFFPPVVSSRWSEFGVKDVTDQLIRIGLLQDK
eukprot:CAMPEP_0196575448 /NCGR_PEP_ID=MMETSP1081-20130531/4924_1 /TAXON_ID=36882 /ORGANISM="Pyramimonas amylifera, Strain CCMP720" /LENGTH=167 /DNA_ID=CAMNT_0041893753 /DNA_START=679 /DNA_END=1182 /DNA_ORIENTATION=+